MPKTWNYKAINNNACLPTTSINGTHYYQIYNAKVAGLCVRIMLQNNSVVIIDKLDALH